MFDVDASLFLGRNNMDALPPANGLRELALFKPWLRFLRSCGLFYGRFRLGLRRAPTVRICVQAPDGLSRVNGIVSYRVVVMSGQ